MAIADDLTTADTNRPAVADIVAESGARIAANETAAKPRDEILHCGTLTMGDEHIRDTSRRQIGSMAGRASSMAETEIDSKERR